AWHTGRAGRLKLAAAVALWCGSIAIAYLGSYRAAGELSYIREYWSAAMLTPGPRWGVRWAAAIREALWPVSYWTVELGAAWLLFLAGLAGAVVLYRRRDSGVALIVAGPFVALLLASAVGQYPIAMRLTGFMGPLL